MHNAPGVYVPTKPEGNGLTLPTLLSLLAHGLVIGILIYTNHKTEIETAGSIETVMVSPEQLAEMQGQILANRAAAAEAASSFASAPSTEVFDSSTGNSSPVSAQPSSQKVPVFMKSERSISENHDADMEEFNRQMEQDANDRIQAPRDEKNKNHLAEQEELTILKKIENNPKIVKSNEGKIKLATTNTINNDPLNLATDGTLNNSSAIDGSKTTNDSGSKESKQQYITKISNEIKSKYVYPSNESGQTIRLVIKVDRFGNVDKVTAKNGSVASNKAAETAVDSASPLSIDLSNPTDYEDLEITLVIPNAVR